MIGDDQWLVIGDDECQIPVEDRFSFSRFASEDSHKQTFHRAARSMKCYQKSLGKNLTRSKKTRNWLPKAPQMVTKAPKGSQKAPGGSPKAPQRCPSEPKGVSRRSQEGPRRLPRAPRWSQGVPKGAPQVPRPLPRSSPGRGLGTYFWGSLKRSTKMRQIWFQDLSVEGEK